MAQAEHSHIPEASPESTTRPMVTRRDLLRTASCATGAALVAGGTAGGVEGSEIMKVLDAPETMSVAADRLDECDRALMELWKEYRCAYGLYVDARVREKPAREAFEAEAPPCPPDVLPGHHWKSLEPLWNKHGLEDMCRERNDLFDAGIALVERIKEIPAQSLVGVAIKLAALRFEYEDADAEEAKASVDIDLYRLTGIRQLAKPLWSEY